MGRARKPTAEKFDAKSTAVFNTTHSSETANDVLDVGSPVTRASKQNAGKNLPESSNPSGTIKKNIPVEESEKVVENLSSKPSLDLESLEKKIDFLVQSVQEFTSRGTKRPFTKEDKASEHNYRSLYLESEKRVEDLTKENHELSKNLELALGKVYGYEQMKDAVGRMGEMVLISNMTKATEAMVNFTSQLTSGKGALPATTGEGLNVDVAVAAAAEQTASLPPQATITGQVTASTVSDEPLLGRSKRARKKKEL